MGSKNGEQVRFNVQTKYGSVGSYLQKFKLYETRSNFYMTGWDKNRTCWKVLKLNRLEQSELSITEDSTAYSQVECDDILKRIHEGNKSTGGLKFVTTYYGIVGFIKFLGPYYMLLITKRRKIGMICGHSVYSIAKSEMIPIQSNMTYSKNENRFKKLLRNVDLTKDFFFSYSYHVMFSLQKNLSNHETGLHLYETMFVWNEFLTRGIRNQLKNSVWTVALVHGFFKQDKLSINGRDFNLILIARRSRHYAGTRYLKRGVNEKGRVANDVETEQIVLEGVAEGCPSQISSVLQNRGSVPLFWSQESSRLNIKPDIILSKKDPGYKATKLHFENMVKRYGNPIILLNLIKTREKKPRESILLAEFANAIEVINKDLAHENRLILYHLDLNRYSRINGAYAMAYLVKGAANVLDLTGFFYCQLPSSASKLSFGNNCNGDNVDGNPCNMNKDVHLNMEDSIIDKCDVGRSRFAKPPMFQKGVLRTNCIDCLDRTNVAQYAYALVALGLQLHALGYIDNPTINLESPLAHDFMRIYEEMGDTLSLQYGGSAAHNKIFAEIRGQWKAATQSQEFFRSLHRYYSNAYMDAEKQDAINVFLGHFLPQQGKPALWELDSDQLYTAGRRGSILAQHASSTIKRSLSDGNILSDSSLAIEEEMDDIDKPLPLKILGQISPSHATSEISTSNSDMSYSRYTSSMSLPRALQPEQQYLENDSVCVTEHGQLFNCSNYLDADRLSSSGTCEEDTYERSLLIGSPTTGLSSGYESGLSLEGKEKAREIPTGFSERFLHWLNGDSLFP